MLIKLGHKQIDEEHITIFAVAKKFLTSDPEEVIKEFEKVYEAHTKTEYDWMLKTNFPTEEIEDHLQAHRIIRESVISFVEPVLNNQLSVELALKVISGLVLLHLQNNDKKLVDWIKSHPL